TVVGHEEIRAEAKRGHGQTLLACEGKSLLQLANRLGSCEGPSPPSRPECCEAGEGDALLDLHSSAFRRTPAAQSTSPAPTVTRRSPGRSTPARRRAPSSTEGTHPMNIPGRRSASASTTSLPVTPSSGCSRAG